MRAGGNVAQIPNLLSPLAQARRPSRLANPVLDYRILASGDSPEMHPLAKFTFCSNRHHANLTLIRQHHSLQAMAPPGKGIHQKLHEKLLRDTLGRTQRLNIVRSVSGFLPNHKASILDIGCGNGLFARDLMATKPHLRIVGVETKPRTDCRINCCVYDGKRLPFQDGQFDYALLINVLHHTDDPALVLSEAARVSAHGVIVKDHYANTRLDFFTLVLMEWIGNAFIDISQPYNFFSETQWGDLFVKLGLRTETIRKRFVSYNALIDLAFGRNLHFIAKIACPAAAGLNRWPLDSAVPHKLPCGVSALGRTALTGQDLYIRP